MKQTAIMCENFSKLLPSRFEESSWLGHTPSPRHTTWSIINLGGEDISMGIVQLEASLWSIGLYL